LGGNGRWTGYPPESLVLGAPSPVTPLPDDHVLTTPALATERSSEFTDVLMVVVSVFGSPSADESAGLRESKPP
jgi:hypothetical protein